MLFPPAVSRRLPGLLAGALLFVSAAAQAKDAPQTTLNARRPPSAVADCLEQSIQRLKIPDSFISSAPLPDGGQSVGLVNPVSGQNGLELRVLPDGAGSRIDVFTHGLEYSKAWRKRVAVCAR